jgi:hypothetical protein
MKKIAGTMFFLFQSGLQEFFFSADRNVFIGIKFSLPS